MHDEFAPLDTRVAAIPPSRAAGRPSRRGRMNAIAFAERRWLPDPLVRFGMRRLMAKRLKAETRGSDDEVAERQRRFVAELAASRSRRGRTSSSSSISARG